MMFWSSVKMLDLKNTWNFPIFVRFPGKSRQVAKKKGCSNNVKINTIRTLQSRGGIRNGICTDASSISGGLTVNASPLLCYCTLWGEKWTSGRYPEASRYGISWPKKDIDLHELTLRTFLSSFPWGKGTLWLMWPRGLQRDGATPVLLLHTKWPQRDKSVFCVLSKFSKLSILPCDWGITEKYSAITWGTTSSKPKTVFPVRVTNV